MSVADLLEFKVLIRESIDGRLRPIFIKEAAGRPKDVEDLLHLKLIRERRAK